MQPVEQEEQTDRWHWRDLQLEDDTGLTTEEPTDPQIGDRWYDRQSHSLCIWDGIEWVAVPLD